MGLNDDLIVLCVDINTGRIAAIGECGSWDGKKDAKT
jgi:hypothetical protein